MAASSTINVKSASCALSIGGGLRLRLQLWQALSRGKGHTPIIHPTFAWLNRGGVGAAGLLQETCPELLKTITPRHVPNPAPDQRLQLDRAASKQNGHLLRICLRLCASVSPALEATWPWECRNGLPARNMAPTKSPP